MYFHFSYLLLLSSSLLMSVPSKYKMKLLLTIMYAVSQKLDLANEINQHFSCHRLQAMGHRASGVPDDHDEDGTHPAGRALRLPQEVFFC